MHTSTRAICIYVALQGLGVPSCSFKGEDDDCSFVYTHLSLSVMPQWREVMKKLADQIHPVTPIPDEMEKLSKNLIPVATSTPVKKKNNADDMSDAPCSVASQRTYFIPLIQYVQDCERCGCSSSQSS